MTFQLSKNQLSNLRFLIVEVASQVSNLQDYISDIDNGLELDALDRSGYIHNLKIRLHNDCYQQMLKADNNESEMTAFRSIDTIANNLERISELCRDCAHHTQDLINKQYMFIDEYKQLLDLVAQGINLVERANQDSDSQQALKIADVQRKLYKKSRLLVKSLGKALKAKKNTDDLITALFVVKSIKSMGDALLKICNAILSRNIGQSVTIERYYSLTRCVEHLQKKEARHHELALDTIAETRSGSAISGISKADKEDILAIFKDGKKRKLKEELQSVKKWHEIYPGVAPKILSYQKQGQSAALLIEHLKGKTFENILLQGSDKLQKKALSQLTRTLSGIWQKTLRKETANPRYMTQLRKRLTDVYAIHPTFAQQSSDIAGVKLPAFDLLLEKVEAREHKLRAPFSVYIHGDFNTDNIIYDPEQNKINFIDLHRSCYMDYVQDISVFLVSNYRLQSLSQPFRQRVLNINLTMYQFAAEFAQQHQDNSFEIRLALGLARSLATSTRFTLDKTLAKAMFYRSRFLIEQVMQTDIKDYTEYHVPIKEIFIG